MRVGKPGRQGKQGEQGEQGEAGAYEAIHPMRWLALTIWIILFTLTTGYVLREVRAQNNAQKALIVANKDLIVDIQQSRIDSCKANYESIREVFFVLVGSPRDARTRKRQARFNKFIDFKKTRCVVQTKPRKG